MKIRLMSILLIMMLLAFCLVLNGQEISDKFDTDLIDLTKWGITEDVGINDLVDYGTRNDSLYFDITHNSGSDNTRIKLDRGDISTYMDKNERIHFDVSFNRAVNSGYAFADGVPGIQFDLGGHFVKIVQAYNDNFGYYSPGYYIEMGNGAYAPVEDEYGNNITDPMDFKIIIKNPIDDGIFRFYDIQIIGYLNGTEKYNYTWGNLMVENNIQITAGVLPWAAYEGTPIDNNIPVNLSMDLMAVYPDYSEPKVTQTNSIYGFKDEVVNFQAEDNYTGYPITDKMVEMNTGDNQTFSTATDLNGEVSFNVNTESDEDITMEMTGDDFYNYSGIIDVTIYNMTVNHIDETPIPKERNFLVQAFDGRIEPELPYPPLRDANVTITNGEDIIYLGLTDALGKYEIFENIRYSKDIDIKVEKETYRTYTGIIHPYMWSHDKNAFGQNNQNSILREANTNIMYMVYSDGDSIIYGYSDDFGKYWYADYIEVENELGEIVTAKGNNSTLVKTDDGLIAMWNHGTNIEYSVLSSPWTPATTFGLPICWNSEPAITGAKSSVYKYGSYIENRNLGIEKGDLIFGKWLDDLIDYIELEIVFNYDGSDGIIPMASPIASAYMKLETESYLTGCISTDNEYIAKLWLPSDNQWEVINRFISLTGQMAMSPSADFDGYNTTFVWEVDNQNGTKDIWGRKLTPYGMTQSGKISVTDGINTYPVNRNDVLYSYINNSNKLIGYRDGFSSPEIPNSYEVYTSSDSIHSIDVNTKKRQIETDVLYAFTEGKNSNYRIKFINKTYGGEVWPIVITPPTDTSVINAVSSPISDYTNGSFPVERLSFTAPVIDPDMSYLVKIITDDKNPHIPQIVMIDGEVVGVIYGDNEETITTIKVPQLLTENGSITISIDRKKGNPNRNTEIQIYDYETDGEEVGVASLNKIVFNKPQAPNSSHQTNLAINFNPSTMDLFYSIPNDLNIKINIFDITGRVVDEVYNGIQTKGNYTYRLNNKTTGIYFAVMEAEGQTYKAKIINIR